MHLVSHPYGEGSFWLNICIDRFGGPGAAEGPVVGVVFKGKRTKDPVDSCGAEALSLKNRSTAGEETP